MIKTFLHEGLRDFFEKGSKAGIQPHHAARLARQLRQLDDAAGPDDMNVPGWRLHPLHEDLEVSPEMALRIEAWLGVERGGRADVWLAGQTAYDLWQARQKGAPHVEHAPLEEGGSA